MGDAKNVKKLIAQQKPKPKAPKRSEKVTLSKNFQRRAKPKGEPKNVLALIAKYLKR